MSVALKRQKSFLFNIKRNTKKEKRIPVLHLWIALHSANIRKNPNAPLAFWPLGPGGAEGAVRARSARPPVRARSARPSASAREARAPRGVPPRVPRAAGSHPTQGVSISTALAKHRSEYMRSVFIRSNLTRVGGNRGA